MRDSRAVPQCGTKQSSNSNISSLGRSLGERPLFLVTQPAPLGRTRPKPSPILGLAYVMTESERSPAGIIAFLRAPILAANRTPIDAIPTQSADRDNF